MSLDHPLWLLALPALAVPIAAVHRWGLSGVGARQRRVALGLRATLTILLVLALAGPRLPLGGDEVGVVFLVDRSDSVAAGSAAATLDLIDEAVASKRAGDRVAVVAFGREPRLEFGMTDAPVIDQITAAPDPTATDISRALRLGAALFPAGTKRRIVLLTDGRETVGDARREAEELARRGIVLEGRTLPVPEGGDTLIEEVAAPSHVSVGAAYQVGVTVRGPGGPAQIELFRDGRRIVRRDVMLDPGRTTIPVDERGREPGLRRYDARVRAASDPVPQNDRATVAVIVTGPPRVLLVHDGHRQDVRPLARALRAGRLAVDIIEPPSLPDLDDLMRYQAVVLVDVPAFRLSADQVARLRAAVVDAGLGLATIGGDSSYGIGGYRGTPLEELLPLDSELTDPERRPSVAQALVIDTSGSMGIENGINKTDISRAGASGAIGALRDEDTVGVLTFNTNSQWLIPLQKRPGEGAVQSALAQMTPEGGTEIGQAVQRAADGLAEVDAKVKHMIMFTDGHSDDSQLTRIAARAAARGITLSIVAVGQSTATVLPDMAAAGGGRYYEGTNLTDVPQVITDEAILASRNYINEGRFRPLITADTPLTRTTRSSPPLRGYVATSAKPTATVELAIGEEEDPLLARRRAGLGSVMSWTSDATTRWSAPWIGWNGFRDFWTSAMRSVFPPTGTGAIAADVHIEGDRLVITIEAARALAGDTTVTAGVIGPDLSRTDVEVSRTGPRSFEGDIPTGGEGVYLAVTAVREGGTTTHRATTATTVPYSAEYLNAAPDETLIADIAEATGGRSAFDPSAAFDPAGLTAETARIALWPLLTILAALLLPVDIAARRLIVTREDLRRARARLRRPRDDTPVREERMDRLLKVAQRRRGA